MVIGLLAHVTPSVVFSRILRSEALVYKSQFFQNIRIQIPMVSIGISHTVHTFNAALTSGSSLADCGCFSRPFWENVSTTEEVTKNTYYPKSMPKMVLLLGKTYAPSGFIGCLMFWLLWTDTLVSYHYN